MKVIEFLASQLDREPLENEVQAPANFFVQNLDFWNLCLECKHLIIEEKLSKEEKNASDKG